MKTAADRRRRARESGAMLGIFIREPVVGKVKKRLAAEVGARQACTIYAACIRRTLERARAARMPLHIFCSPPDSARRVARRFQISETLSPQKGRTLGERMKHAFREMLRHAPAAILIGSDSPDLPRSTLRRAGLALRGGELVIAPAEDGGYVLIGLTRGGFLKAAGLIFSRIPWGTSEVCALTLQRARRRCGKIAVLPRWYDVDTESAARRAGFC